MSEVTGPDADIVLRSSDGFQFRVRKSVLSLASPVFNDLFLIPQPNSTTDSDTPDIIDVSETRNTIGLIIDLCTTSYFSLARVHSLSDIASLLQAADKYDIKSIQENALCELARPKFLKKEPLRVYAVASRYRAYETAALAARHLLQYPLLHPTYVPELEIVDGGTIYRVLQYHMQCLTVALEVATDHTWIRDGTYVFIDCPEALSDDGDDADADEGLKPRTTTIRTQRSRKYKNGFPKTVSVHLWWFEFMAATKIALSESIDAETIQDNRRTKEALASAYACSHCRKHIKLDFARFLDDFVNEVERRLDEIKFVQPGAPEQGHILWC